MAAEAIRKIAEVLGVTTLMLFRRSQTGSSGRTHVHRSQAKRAPEGSTETGRVGEAKILGNLDDGQRV